MGCKDLIVCFSLLGIIEDVLEAAATCSFVPEAEAPAFFAFFFEDLAEFIGGALGHGDGGKSVFSDKISLRRPTMSSTSSGENPWLSIPASKVSQVAAPQPTQCRPRLVI